MEGVLYTVDPSEGATAPWVPTTLPEGSNQILSMQLTSDSKVILYRRRNDPINSCTRRMLDAETGESVWMRMLTTTSIEDGLIPLGSPQAISVSRNTDG